MGRGDELGDLSVAGEALMCTVGSIKVHPNQVCAALVFLRNFWPMYMWLLVVAALGSSCVMPALRISCFVESARLRGV
jgi:hypothetical protein